MEIQDFIQNFADQFEDLCINELCYLDESQMRFSYNPQQTFPSRCRLKFLYETGIL